MDDLQAPQNAPRKRRHLSGEKKYQVLQEVKTNPAKKTEILRREFGIQEKALAALTVEFLTLKKKVNGE